MWIRTYIQTYIKNNNFKNRQSDFVTYKKNLNELKKKLLPSANQTTKQFLAEI